MEVEEKCSECDQNLHKQPPFNDDAVLCRNEKCSRFGLWVDSGSED